MKRKMFIISVIVSQFLLTSCGYQGGYLLDPLTDGKGNNTATCKSVQNSCQRKGSYEEWWNEKTEEVSCACRGVN